MSKIKAIVHGLGNIGRGVIEALECAPDMECLGVVRTPSSVGTKAQDLRGRPDFPSLDDLIKAQGQPQVAILCGPSRLVPEDAARYLAAGLNVVDSFDIHSEILPLVKRLEGEASKAGRAAVVGAGWDPGSDSALRAIFEAMVPSGTTFTNFGRGLSMGHSVAARAIKGVADALSLTIPAGGGRHMRLVYVVPEAGFAQDSIQAALAADSYFSHDPLEVRFVETKEELKTVADQSHGVLLERTGASGLTSNQRLSFDMRIDNPALTSQVMVSAARATTRLAPGAYTLIDIPPVALLPGERETHIRRLV